jgi:phospholipase/carboxylesterase
VETKLNLSGAADSEECDQVSQGRSLWLYTKQALPAPIERNESNLSSALSAISRVIERRGKAGISRERTILLGFSQGACLALEFAARNPQRFGGFVGLSGGLIGPEGTLWNYPGSLADTPVFLGCSGPARSAHS